MSGRVWMTAAALGVLLATGGVVALARALTPTGGEGPGAVPCPTSAVAVAGRDAADPTTPLTGTGAPPATAGPTTPLAGPASVTAGPTASPGTDDYWTPERMRAAKGAAQGENADGEPTPGPSSTCR